MTAPALKPADVKPALPDANPAEMFAFKEGRALLVRLGGDK